MSLNSGPQPNVEQINNVRFVDPNPTNEIVNHEDLVMYVKLVARTKGRSILTTSDDDTNKQVIGELTSKNVKDGATNFTYPDGKQFLDTSWTNMGGNGLVLGENLGSFGITNINIEFKSSFMPQITIDFVDVRGAALFEQGPCSPYSLFFHLPYPVFELTVKGYYGKPVTYTLALIKFNTKFNSETGNFESKGEFVGYTYAFLADLPIGYIMAASYMDGTQEILANKWEKAIGSFNDSDPNSLDPKKPMTILDLIKASKRLETETETLKSTNEVKNIGKLNRLRNRLRNVREKITEYERELGSIKVGKKTNGKNGKFNFEEGNVKEVESINEKYLGPDNDKVEGIIGTAISQFETDVKTFGSLESPLSVTIKTEKGKYFSGFFGVDVDVFDGIYVKTYEGLVKPIEDRIKSIENRYKENKKETQKKLDQAVKNILGFWPSVKNVFIVLTVNTEVFLEMLAKTSVSAENYHAGEDFSSLSGSQDNLLELKDKNNGTQSDTTTKNVTIYPWPTYYQTITKTSSEGGGYSGEKETYPGERTDFLPWPEVTFVENFIKALVKLGKETPDDVSEVDNKPGFDNYYPITAFETHAFGQDTAPSRWYKIQNGVDKLSPIDSIHLIAGENAFLAGDYSMINSLSVWKSQLGLEQWGDNGPRRISYYTDIKRFGRNQSFNFDTAPNGMFKGKVSPTTKERMTQMGKADALNLLSFLTTDKQTELINSLKNGLGDKEAFKKRVKEVLKGKYPKDKYRETSFDDWKKIAMLDAGIGEGNYAPINEQGSIWSGYFDYVSNKKNNVLILKGPIKLNYDETYKTVDIHANPHNNSFGGVNLISKDTLESRTINFDKDILGEKLFEEFKKVVGVSKEVSEIPDSTSQQDKKSTSTVTPENIITTTLSNLPVPSGNPKDDPYSNYGTKNSKVKSFTLSGNLNMLTYNFGDFRTLFFKTYEDKNGGDLGIYPDLGGTRFIYKNEDAFVQTELWFKNLPSNKNRILTGDFNKLILYGGNPENKYGGDNNIDLNVLPLAYLSVMSFGSKNSGYSIPFDGDEIIIDSGKANVSSFTNFTHSHVMTETPRAWLLMLGAILWRCRESGLLTWDKSKDGVGITPIYEGGWGNNSGGDPIWFFPDNKEKCEPYEIPFFDGDIYQPQTLDVNNPGFTLPYHNIQKNIKELMFLPKEFKEQLIEYFVKWAKDEYLDESRGWLTTLDPLNWGKEDEYQDKIFNGLINGGTKRLNGDFNNNKIYNKWFNSYYTEKLK